MPQQTLNLTAFNAGAFTPLARGRVDLARYKYALKESLNGVAIPLGPWLAWPGTEFRLATRDETKKGWLIPFQFSGEQSIMLEFADQALRFHDNSGLVVYDTVDATAGAAGASDLTLTLPGHDFVVGEFGAFVGFADALMLSGSVAEVTAVAGDDVTFDVTPPAGYAYAAGQGAAKVLEVATPYAAEDLQHLRYAQSLDVVYLFCGKKGADERGYPVQKLTRLGTLDWTLAPAAFADGPYLQVEPKQPTITPDVTGQAVIAMTANTDGGYTATASGSAVSRDPYFAFDQNEETYWEADTDQSATLAIELPSAVTVTGYSISAAASSADDSYTSTDYAPSTWRLQGSNDGTTWTLLDKQVTFVAYEKRKTPYIAIANTTAYLHYRIVIAACVRNGPLKPRIGHLTLGTDGETVTLTAASTSKINGGSGFLSTDVDRLIRLRGSDLNWRALRITAVNSTTEAEATLEGEPLPNLQRTSEWRLGLFSDTTGHPRDGLFWGDRFILGGVRDFPSVLAGSRTQDYESFAPTDPDGVVDPSNGFTLEIVNRRLAAIQWLADLGADRGLAVGTSAGPVQVSRINSQDAFSASNAKQSPVNDEECAALDALQVATAVLFVPQNRKRVLELAYVFQDDGFKAPNLTQLASHLFATNRIDQLVFSRAPYPVVYARRADGTLALAVYNRDEDVVGWGEYDGGGVIESIAVMPDADVDQQRAWMIVQRGARRFIERMYPIWEEGFTVEDTAFVQAGLRYSGAAADTFYLPHLDGLEVVGLADGAPISPQTVTGGVITLPEAVETAVLGLGFEARAETISLEGGAAPGSTAQGQQKRVHELVLHLYATGTCDVGWRRDGTVLAETLNFRKSSDGLGAPPPLADNFHLMTFPGGTEREATIFWRRPAAQPLPLNVVALMPKVETQA